MIPEGQDQRKFKGLFGIHGSLSFYLEEKSGVPVSIEGTVPIGPLNLIATIRLKSYTGTPDDFRPR